MNGKGPGSGNELSASVVIPSYNHAAYVVEALESALSSPVSAVEVVVVDDGSSDDTLECLAPFRTHPQVRIFEQENRGAHAALARCIALSRGEIVFILNSDDTFEPERIPRFLERFAGNPDLVLLCSWITIVDAQGKTVGVKQGWKNLPPWPVPHAGPSLEGTGDLALALLQTNFVATTSNMAFRRDVYENHGLCFAPLRYAHDWDFILTMSMLGSIELIPEPLVRYRVHTCNTIREELQNRHARAEMRFEVLWIVARHAFNLVTHGKERGYGERELWERFWNSAPRFGCEALLAQLLTLRGTSAAVPLVFDALVEKEHPFRRAAVDVLMKN